MAPDKSSPKFQIKAVAMPITIMAIAVVRLTACCQTLKTNKGPKPEANADQEKVTKAKTLDLLQKSDIKCDREPVG